MTERAFDPGLDTPTAYEAGAGAPVPGSPVHQDAQLREEANERQRRLDLEANEKPEVRVEHPVMADDSKTSAAHAAKAAQAKKAQAAEKATDRGAAATK